MTVRENPPAASVEQMEAELLTLRARVAELERQQADAPRPSLPPPRRDTLDVLRPALIHWTPDGLITQWDRRAERLFGIPAAEAVGQSFMQLLFADSIPPDRVKPAIDLILTGKLTRSRGVHESRSGQMLVCEWSNGVSRDPQGNPKEIVSVVRDVGSEIGESQVVRDSQQILLGLVDTLPSVVTVKDRKGRCILANKRVETVLGIPRDKVIGMTMNEAFPPEVAVELQRKDDEAIAAGKAVETEEIVQTVDGPRECLCVRFPLYDAHNALIGLCTVTTDITRQKRAEAERTALQEQVIAAQQDALRELSTPLLPVSDGVLVLPLLGAIDSTRAGQILEALLDGIGKQRAHTAIMDITGVRVVDAQVAAALVQSARAARLLGARVVLTGVSPEVARTLVTLGTELSGIVTLGTLEGGIAFALRRR